MGREEVILKGKTYPCRFLMGALVRFKQETKKEITELKPEDVSDACTFIWCCVKSSSAADGVEFDLTPLEVADSLTPEVFADLMGRLMGGLAGQAGEKKT